MISLLVGVIVVVVVALLVIIFSYNNLISKRNRVQDASAQIDVQLKRRYDLIPNLINTVKGYAKYERGVLTQVTKLRSSIITGSMQDKATANNQLSQALKSIFAVAESYPDLKASQNFKQLQDELEDTEDKISFVRTSYNDYVLDFNNAMQTFPGNVFAGWFHFQKADFFQTPEEQKDLDSSQPSAPAPQQKAPTKKSPTKKKS